MSERLDAQLDAIAYVRASITGDDEARIAVARGCDLNGMVDAIIGMFVAQLLVTTDDPLDYLDSYRQFVERALRTA